MKTLLLIVLTLLFSVPGMADSSQALQGSWLSNAQLTIKSIEEQRQINDEEREALGRLFGKLKLTFGPNTVEVDQGIPAPTTTVFEEPFAVISTGTNFVVVEFGTEETGITQTKYVFEGDCIKTNVEAVLSVKNFFEYFCKLE